MPQGRYTTLNHTPTRRDPAGIDLFAEEIGGTVQTTIYKRFRGGRVFARSVDPAEDHHDETVQAWTAEADDVRDFRPSATRRVESACQLLSGAVGAIRAHTREGDMTAAWVLKALEPALTSAEKAVVGANLSGGRPGGDVPPIDPGSTWSDTAGPGFTVRSISVDEDGTPQVYIQEHAGGPEHEGAGRSLSVPAEDIRHRAAAGEIQRVG
jgi:hypothetical protein